MRRKTEIEKDYQALRKVIGISSLGKIVSIVAVVAIFVAYYCTKRFSRDFTYFLFGFMILYMFYYLIGLLAEGQYEIREELDKLYHQLGRESNTATNSKDKSLEKEA